MNLIFFSYDDDEIYLGEIISAPNLSHNVRPILSAAEYDSQITYDKYSVNTNQIFKVYPSEILSLDAATKFDIKYHHLIFKGLIVDLFKT